MKHQLFLFVFVLPILFCSCISRRYVHNPVAVNNPFFTTQHDSRVGIYKSGSFTGSDSDYNRGFDIMAAYAVSNHVAVTASFFGRHEQNTYDKYYDSPFDTSLVTYRRSGWEAGAGYFAPLDPDKHLSLNLYGGIGSGSLRIREQGIDTGVGYTRYHQSSPFKFYIQPSINFLSSVARFGIAYRFNFLRFKNIDTDYSPTEQEAFEISGLGSRTVFYRELAFELHLIIPKLPWLSLESQISFCNNKSYYQSRAGNASIGLSADVYKLLKRH